MTITEIPRHVRAVARASKGGLVARFLAPWFLRHRKLSGRAPVSSRAQDRKPENNSASLSSVGAATQSNAPLDSLSGGALESRFHAWHGASGRRYICSVFAVDRTNAGSDTGSDVGLPDFAESIALAVACDAEGRRRSLALFVNDEAVQSAERRAFIAAALTAGAVEWHVHLLAADAQQRRMIAQDIQAGRFAEASAVR